MIFCNNCDTEATAYYRTEKAGDFFLCSACADAFELGQVNPDVCLCGVEEYHETVALGKRVEKIIDAVTELQEYRDVILMFDTTENYEWILDPRTSIADIVEWAKKRHGLPAGTDPWLQ